MKSEVKKDFFITNIRGQNRCTSMQFVKPRLWVRLSGLFWGKEMCGEFDMMKVSVICE